MKPSRPACDHCGGELWHWNPQGYCDHRDYPEKCKVCKKSIVKRYKEAMNSGDPFKELSQNVSRMQKIIGLMIDDIEKETL